MPTKLVPLASIQPSIDADIGIELGVTNVIPGSSWSSWATSLGNKQKTDSLVVGRDPLAPSTAELVQMGRRDGQARALLSLVTLPIRSALTMGEWKAPEGEDPEHECVTYANDMWTMAPRGGGMATPRSKIIRQTALAALHGFSTFEHVRKVSQEEGPLKGKIVLQKLAYRDPRTIFFLCNEVGDFAGVRQIASFGRRTVDVIIPPDKVWYWAVNEEENPFYGVSMFESAFEHYQIKRKLYYISHMAAQFAATPGRLGMLPPNPGHTQLEQFRAAIQSFAMNTAMLVPNGYDVKPFNATSSFDFLKYVDHHNTLMATSVLAKFLQQEDRMVLIDNGKADASADMFVQQLQSLIMDIAESWTAHMIPQYIDFNFSKPVYPVFTPAPLTDDQKSALVTVFNSLALASTLNCTPEFVRETEKAMAKQFGYDIDYDAIAKREEEQQKQAEEQAKQQQQAEQAAPDQAPPDQTAPPPPSGKPAAQPKIAAQPGGDNVGMSATDSIDDLLFQLAKIRPEPEQAPLGLDDA